MAEPEGQEPEGTEETEAKEDMFDRETVERLRKEAAGYRVERNKLREQVEALTSKVSKFEDATKSETERLEERAKEAERLLVEKDKALVEMALRAEVQAEAIALGIQDPEAAFKLLDPELLEIDGSQIKGVKRALERLLKEKPYLKKEPPAPPSPGPGGQPISGSGAKNLNDTILGALNHMAREKGLKR